MKLWRGQPDNWSWKPTTRDIARFWIGFSVFIFILAYVEVRYPWQSPTYTGRWAWLKNLAVAAFGPDGVTILYTALGTASLTYGIVKYSRRTP